MTRADEAIRLATRFRRLEVQITAFREMHVREVTELADRLAAIAKLHGSELQSIVDELADILSAAGALAAGPTAEPTGGTTPDVGSVAADPAASSPKRAKWLAERERRAHVSRRDLLRGRDDR